jgi:hypothetical protein
MAAKVVASVPGTQLVRRSPVGTSIFLQHRLTTQYSLNCLRDPIWLTIVWDSRFPAAAFFDLAAHAGSVVSDVPRGEVHKHITKCHQDALHSSTEIAKSWSEDLWVECHARAFGGGSLFVIHPNRVPKS